MDEPTIRGIESLPRLYCRWETLSNNRQEKRMHNSGNCRPSRDYPVNPRGPRRPPLPWPGNPAGLDRAGQSDPYTIFASSRARSTAPSMTCSVVSGPPINVGWATTLWMSSKPMNPRIVSM